MSTDNSTVFSKDNLDFYLKEVSKEYKKRGGRNIPVEIILIGGAAIVENYGFREMTTDIDAILPAASVLQEAINYVGDKYGLPNGWMNADFVKTNSYSRKLALYSVPYKTFNQVLNVRTVTGEYLIAMKLRAGRKYKNDLSDVVGILAEQQKAGQPISYDEIDVAVRNLYGGWDDFSPDVVTFVHEMMQIDNFTEAYMQIRESEVQAKDTLLGFQENYPGVMNADNVDNIIENRNKKENRVSVLEQLKMLREQEQARNVKEIREKKISHQSWER